MTEFSRKCQQWGGVGIDKQFRRGEMAGWMSTQTMESDEHFFLRATGDISLFNNQLHSR